MVTTNAVDLTTAGITGYNGTGTWTGSPATQYNVQVGGATTNTLASVAPSATSGVPLISQGAASNPAFGTAVVAGGGTGITSATAYAVLTGGTTSTNPFQSVASVGTSLQVLTSNGASALPTFQTLPFTVTKSVVTQASAVSLTSGVSADITSITLTAGTWYISACVMDNSTTTTNMSVGISTTSATLPTNLGDNFAFGGSANINAATINSYIVTPGGSTTYYLVCRVNGTGTLTGWGNITAIKWST